MLKEKTKHIIRVQLALLFLAMFTFTLVSKPLHTLLVHHNVSESYCTFQHEKSVTANHFQECFICEFEFCTYISQGQVNVPQTNVIVCEAATPQLVSCIIQRSSHHFQLRAPPVI
jgi:hypothetical protein